MRFPDFTGEWKHTKVSELLQFYSTNSLSWEQLNYDDGDILNLHYGLIHKGVPTIVDAEKETLPFISEGNEPRNYTVCKSGDVAFADASEDTNDVGKAIEFVNVGTHEIVCGLHTIHGRDKTETTIPGFKGYAFASTAFHNQVRRIAQGTKIYSISVKNFGEIFIGIPQKEEQTKIARLLSLIDERIATQNKIIEDLKKLRSAIIERLFCEKNTTRIRLGDIGTFVRGLTYNSNDVCENSSATIVIRANNLDYGEEVNYNEDVVYVKKDITQFDCLKKGDIAICMANGSSSLVGKNSIYTGQETNITVGAFCGIFRSQYHLIRWLLQTNQYKRNVYQSLQGGNGAIANLNREDILNMYFNIPPTDHELTVYQCLSGLDGKIKTEQELLGLYGLQKKHLISQMFI